MGRLTLSEQGEGMEGEVRGRLGLELEGVREEKPWVVCKMKKKTFKIKMNNKKKEQTDRGSISAASFDIMTRLEECDSKPEGFQVWFCCSQTQGLEMRCRVYQYFKPFPSGMETSQC